MSERLTHEAVANLYPRIKLSIYDVPRGWLPLIPPVLSRIMRAMPDDPEAWVHLDGDERWGRLRLLLTTDRVNEAGYRSMQGACAYAEKAAEHLCQRCGAAGAAHGLVRGWYVTMCPTCKRDREDGR